jgi:hypothetical protein
VTATPQAQTPLRPWVVHVAAAETAGFLIPVAVWAKLWAADAPPLAVLVLVPLAGAGEGAALGWAQARHLAVGIPGIRRPWVARTAVAAAAAWALGLLPNTTYDLGAPAWLAVALAVVAALPLLLSIGFAQYTVLRDHLDRAWRWIPVNAGAWIPGLPATFIFPALVPNGSPAWLWIAAFGAAGLTMATIVAWVTGLGLRALRAL